VVTECYSLAYWTK